VRWTWGLSLALVYVACAEPSRDMTYSERRSAPPLLRPVLTLSDSQRFGVMGADTAQREEPEESPIMWVGPPGWDELPPTSMRLANYGVGAEGECYLTILGGGGGGVHGNVNRWRDQMGLGEISPAEVEALPRVNLLGRDAYLLELEGAYRGMGTEVRDGWALRGAILGSDRFTIFVKFTGPLEVVRLQRDAFDAFCASIGLHEHAAGDGAPQATTGAESAGGVAWEVPAGWTVEAGSGMRLVTFHIGAVECYLTVLGGDGGGVVGNIQRWVGQLGLTPPTEAEVKALPTVEVLGVESHLLEATGEYSGMGAAQPTPDITMLGIACVLEDRAIFIKMLGPSAEVSVERDRFLAFVASMRLEGGGR